MTMAYTQDEYYDFLLTPADSNGLAGTDALEYAPGFPGWLRPYDDMFRWSQQQLRETWSITTMKHVNVASPTARTDTSPWGCHNCSCGTRAVENPTPYRKRTGTIPTEGSVIISWRSVASISLLAMRICFSTIVLYIYFSPLAFRPVFGSYAPPPPCSSSRFFPFFPPPSLSLYGGGGLHPSVRCPPACCVLFVLANFLRNFLLNSTHILHVTTRRPWFDYFPLCAIWRWSVSRKLNTSSHI